MRNTIETQVFELRNNNDQTELLTYLTTVPLDNHNPVEVIIRERIASRSEQQKRLYHSMIDQMVDAIRPTGRRFDKHTWHYYMKQAYLPELSDERYTKKGYKKWSFLPTGEQVLTGSTDDLTVGGFSQFLDHVLQFCAENQMEINI